LDAGEGIRGHWSPSSCPGLKPCLGHPVSATGSIGTKRLDTQDGAGCHECFLREGGLGARRELQERAHACLQHAPAPCPWLRFPAQCKPVLPKRRRKAAPSQASQCASEIGPQQELINCCQCR